MASTRTLVSIADHPVGDNPFGRGHEDAPSTEGGSRGGVRRVESQTLLSGDREIEIEHNGVLYRLRQTSMGKLILTK